MRRHRGQSQVDSAKPNRAGDIAATAVSTRTGQAKPTRRKCPHRGQSQVVKARPNQEGDSAVTVDITRVHAAKPNHVEDNAALWSALARYSQTKPSRGQLRQPSQSQVDGTNQTKRGTVPPPWPAPGRQVKQNQT